MLDNENFKTWAIVIGRVSLGLLFVFAGYNKIGGFDGTAAYIASKGLPLPEVGAAIAVLVELVGGLMIVVGFQARWAALALAIFIVPLNLFFHPFWEDGGQFNAFFKNLSILGGMLFLAVHGAGKFSFDNR